MEAKEYLKEYVTDNTNGMLSYNSVIRVMEGYAAHVLYKEKLNQLKTK